MFTNTLQGVYFERMIGSVSSGFSDLVRIGERIESGVKTGKIQIGASTQNNMTRPINNFTKKKEGNTNSVAHQQSVMPVQYVPYIATAPQQKVKKVFDPIPVPYRDLLPYLIHSKMVTPRTLKPMVAPFLAWYKQGSKCEYHSGAEGHTIENCKAFMYKVQDLIDQKWLTFKEVGPNVKGNPLPSHSGANVNHVSSAEGLIRDVADIRTPLISVREALLSYDQFSDMHA
jgi:hypothetical protein